MLRCDSMHFGAACEEPCVNGVISPAEPQVCHCHQGWAGINCDSECSEHGTIIGGRCDCDVGWRGPVCDIPGCPGVGLDCTGHGLCNAATHVCTCFPGWSGDGCHIADCPGSPNCNNRGVCNATLDPPLCLDCQQGWMGSACEEVCEHGHQEPPNSGVCQCDPCYSGRSSCNSVYVNHQSVRLRIMKIEIFEICLSLKILQDSAFT